jgi:hypothetical protein
MAHLVSNDSGAARLALCDRAKTKDAVDGAWWPQSRDLRTELPDLISVFGRWIGPVRRVVYDPSLWLPAPSRIVRGTTSIAVDPYRLVARDTIYLMGTHHRDAVLFVVPPTSKDELVRRVLCAVSDSAQPMSVGLLRQLVRRLAAGSGWLVEPLP